MPSSASPIAPMGSRSVTISGSSRRSTTSSGHLCPAETAVVLSVDETSQVPGSGPFSIPRYSLVEEASVK